MAGDSKSILLVFGATALLILASVIGVLVIMNSPNEDKSVFTEGDTSYKVVSEVKQTVLLYRYNGTAEDVNYTILETIDNKGKTYDIIGVADNAFKNKTGITSVSYEGSKDLSFYDNSFSGCSNLASIDLTHVVYIGNSAFYGCLHLSDVVSDLSSVEKIGRYAFYGCTSLSTELKLDSVTDIGVRAFDNCKALTYVTISDKITVIREGTFFFCESLLKLPFNNNIVTIEDYAFCDCRMATSTTISTDETRALIPSTVTSIGKYSFCRCLTIGNYDFNNDLRATGLTISSNAFEECGGFNMTLPARLTSIADYAFNGCNIKSIVIPANVTSIGNNAFCGTTFHNELGNVVSPNLNFLKGHTFDRYNGEDFHLIRQASP